jgi:hypothetical protein
MMGGSSEFIWIKKEGLWNVWTDDWELLGAREYTQGQISLEYHIRRGK